jgi:hypothetical protein
MSILSYLPSVFNGSFENSNDLQQKLAWFIYEPLNLNNWMKVEGILKIE